MIPLDRLFFISLSRFLGLERAQVNKGAEIGMTGRSIVV